MSQPVFFKAIYLQDKKMFEFTMNLDGNRRAKIELTPDQFLGLAAYLAKVGVSFQEALKAGDI